jgi:lipid A 3-O-deacylase
MKFIFLSMIFISSLLANEEVWSLKTINFTMENDADFETDFSYTNGLRTSVLFARDNLDTNSLHIPFTKVENKDHYIAFSYANQMYTPQDVDRAELIKDDRPYAGWSYIELGLHQATSTQLSSLTTQLGVIGPASKMQELQDSFHDWIDVRHAEGWDHQLHNEITVQLNYMHKWRYQYQDIFGLNSVLIPYSGINVGNVSLRASGGALYRIGFYIPNDFGINSMNEGSFPSIPTREYNTLQSSWSFYFNFLSGVNLIARDIFTDGNTFKDSHSVERYPYNAYVGAGVSIRYQKFTLNYTHQYYSKDYKLRGEYEKYLGYGLVLLEYQF